MRPSRYRHSQTSSIEHRPQALIDRLPGQYCGADKGLLPRARRYANNIAVGIANVQQTLAPSHYILHGDVVLGGAPMIEAIANHVRRLVPNWPGLNIEISAGGPRDRAALLGAAGLVLSELLRRCCHANDSAHPCGG